MKLSVVQVGKNKTLAKAIAEYDRRANRYWKLSEVTVPVGRGSTPAEVRRREGEALAKKLRPDYRLIVLSREGKPINSGGLADQLQKWANQATAGVHFVIGGAFGLDSALLERADLCVSLSGMTLPHEFARLLVAEQLYRAGTILKNEPYHKGPR